ncbi:MAG: M66 family metalloprotease [Bacteroidota bacterium]|nr:M66 family metalloprotease [Bacteroidota bacterium]
MSGNSLTGEIPSDLGQLSRLQHLYLNANSLTGSIPPEFGNLAQVRTLWLFDNGLTGSIPPELGNLTQVADLALSNNFLTGSIPSELDRLTSLQWLLINDNNDLTGLLPRSFIKNNLAGLRLHGTRICRHRDAVFQKWWNTVLHKSGGDCTPDQVERLALLELYDQTNGPSWRNATGWGRDSSLDTWHGVSTVNGRVTELVLPGNGLAGPIPGEVANFTALTVLNLADNSLSGTLSEEISLLSNLTELRVNDNSALEGSLRYDLTNLFNLDVFHFGGTSLCVSPASKIQTWYTGIQDARGRICGNPTEVQLDVPVAYLVQSIQTQRSSVPLVQGREALLRVFVTGGTAAEPAFFAPQVVATIQEAGRTHQVTMTQNSVRLTMTVDESDLNYSFNAVIPGEFITPGSTLVVEADPEGVVPRAAGSQDRFPATGGASLNVVSVPAMDVTVVPVLEAAEPDRSIFEWTDNISDNSSEVGLFKYALPFHEFRARSRESYITSLGLVSSGGRWGLVLELEALRLLDGATGYYYGAAASVNGFVRGIARLGGWVSMGKALDEELAHEVGHNLNLNHAPCGGALVTDPDFPYSNGSVGAWGYDFRDGTLISPAFHKDIMGYCYQQGWLSDFFYEKVIDFRERVEGNRGPAIAGAVPESDVLVVWGGVQGGELRLEPPFQASAAAQLPEMDGPYRLDGIGGDTVLFSISFTPGEDKFGNKYFLFALPIEPQWDETLERITLTGPEGSITINANDQRSLSIVRDATTGNVRSILRDWDGDLPAVLEEIGDLNIRTSQGLMDSVQTQR